VDDFVRVTDYAVCMKNPRSQMLLSVTRWLSFSAIVIVVLVCSDRATVFADENAQQKVAPFFSKFCLNCHGAKKLEGDFSLLEVGANPRVADHVKSWKKILDKLELREMPPDDSKQPNFAATQHIVKWIKQELRAAGVKIDDGKWLNPSRGNWVDHDTLFSGKPKNKTATTARLWRLDGSSV
jgi:hypothetical protein